jgi:hypothetical protein
MQRKGRDWDERGVRGSVRRAPLELERRCLAVPRKFVTRFRPAHLLCLEQADGGRGGCAEIAGER